MPAPDLALVEDLCAAYSVDVDQSPWALSPRVALRLYAEAVLVADLARDDSGYFTEVAGILPPAAVTQATPEFLERFRQSFEDLARRLRHPHAADGPLPQCVGDEVALAHVLTLAGDASLEPDQPGIDPELALLPSCPDFDEEFDFYDGCLFADRDFELLWHTEMADVAQDDEQAFALRLLNLRPERWFLPFST